MNKIIQKAEFSQGDCRVSQKSCALVGLEEANICAGAPRAMCSKGMPIFLRVRQSLVDNH